MAPIVSSEKLVMETFQKEFLQAFGPQRMTPNIGTSAGAIFGTTFASSYRSDSARANLSEGCAVVQSQPRWYKSSKDLYYSSFLE